MILIIVLGVFNDFLVIFMHNQENCIKIFCLKYKYNKEFEKLFQLLRTKQ